MELRYAGLVSLVVILSFVVKGTAARPIAGSASETSAIVRIQATVDSPSKVQDPILDSTLQEVDLERSDQETPVTEKLTTVSWEEEGVRHEERMLAASTDDYTDPITNENPRHVEP